MWQVIRVFVLVWVAGAASEGACGERWEVRTRGGTVRGARAADGDYYSFLGVPYGAPPTGDYRYRAPRPAAPWSGVLEANASRLCVQPRDPGGEEDCLVLNVFAPAPAAPRPVLVYIHGGGFLFNTAPSKGVGPLLSHDIIVVTINYRLGALGFLSLGTEEALGNAGLRDQILALQWVQENIAAFGGDPTRVTAAGTSVGAASVQLLASSPAADDLFHRAVCMSGTAVGDYAIMTYPLSSARFFAKLLGFENNNVEELTKYYKTVAVEDIRNQSMNFFNLPDGEAGFSPCVERAVGVTEPVVAQAPVRALARNTRPMLFTYCDDEGSMRATDLIKNQLKYNKDFPAFMPINLDFPSDQVKYQEANKTKSFYFGNKTISAETAVEFSKFWGDRQFVYPAAFSAREHARLGGMAHLLEFTYVGNLSYAKDSPAAPGASHGDIINYLMPQTVVKDENDRRVVDEITSIVTQFVKTGEARASVAWPAASADSGRLMRLRLGSATETRDESAPAWLVFWDRLYSRYRRTDYSALDEQNS